MHLGGFEGGWGVCAALDGVVGVGVGEKERQKVWGYVSEDR